jgi:hypothetical protein
LLPIIIATGYAELPQGGPEDPSLLRLSKPFRQQDLAAAIASVVKASAANGARDVLVGR